MQATANVILDTRRMKQKTNSYPVKLRVTFQRKVRDYQTVFDLSLGDYEKLSAPRIGEKLQMVRERLKSAKNRCEDFIKELTSFSFHEFERDFITKHEVFKPRKKIAEPTTMGESDPFDYSSYVRRFPLFQENHSKPESISRVYFSYIKKLLEEERIGTALSYQHSYNSIKKFRGNVLFTDITTSFLIQYEKWMLKKGCTLTTVGIKLRPLRTMFIEAIEMGIIKREKNYPFGRRKYQIPTGRNIKKALDQNNIGEIYYYQPEHLNDRKAKDFWLFCYFGNGMNPKDVVYLKNKDIQDSYLTFIRSKTERATRKEPKHITVYVTDDMWGIIERWGNNDKKPDSYLFPIMNPELDPLQQYEVVTAFTQFVNDGMKRITEHLGIDKKITTIVSRHSFSTQLKRSGVSTEYIQEALGHTDLKTTENYLDSFGNDVKKEFATKLMAFKKKS